jgi:hypothetical protein
MKEINEMYKRDLYRSARKPASSGGGGGGVFQQQIWHS